MKKISTKQVAIVMMLVVNITGEKGQPKIYTSELSSKDSGILMKYLKKTSLIETSQLDQGKNHLPPTILTPTIETPDPPNDTPKKASKQVAT